MMEKIFLIETVFLLLWQLNIQDKCLFFKKKNQQQNNSPHSSVIVSTLTSRVFKWGEKNLSSISFSYIFY